MQPAVSPAAQRFQAVIGPAFQVQEFTRTTRTAADAAAAVGCAVGQIAKSLVFRTALGEVPVLAVTSGANRVDAGKLSALVGEEVRRADADWVREATGYAVGGIPPCGHRRRGHVLLDRDLLAFDHFWAAAGTPNAVFRLTPAELEAITEGRWADVAERPVLVEG